MSVITRSYLPVVSICVLTSLTIVGEDFGKGGDVALVLRVDASEIVQSEPLGFTLALANVSAKSKRVPIAWSSGAELLCALDKETMAVCGHSGRFALDVVGWREVEAGSRIYDRGTVFLHGINRRDPFVFDRAGAYRLKARVEFEGAPLESEEVDIFVKPVPPIEHKPLVMFQRTPFAFAVQGRDLSDKSAEQARELIAAYPSSMYADHARRFLGSYWYYKVSAGSQGDRAAAAEKAYAAFGGVSPRIGALRLRALIGMGKVASYCVPDRRKSPEYKAILEELEAYKPLAKEIGLEQEAADILKAGQPEAH